MAELDLDLESRRLCPDGACIGVLDEHGRCKVCGTVAPGTPYRDAVDAVGVDAVGAATAKAVEAQELERAEAAEVAEGDPLDGEGDDVGDDADDGDADDDADDEDDEDDADDDAVDASADDDRELCPDGSCVGLIGANGRCKVCGTPRATHRN